MFGFQDKVGLASVNSFDSSRPSRSESTYLLLSRLQISNRKLFLCVKKEKSTMSVKSVLCLLVVLTCYRGISGNTGKLRRTGLYCMVRYSEPTRCEKSYLPHKIRACSIYYGSGSHFSQILYPIQLL